MFCKFCDLPFCFQCKEDRKKNRLNIRTAYKTNRQKHEEIIHNIRSETLYNSSCLLAGIRSDIEKCYKVISNIQRKMAIKAKKLRNVIDTVMHDAKIKHKRFIQRLQQQRRKTNRHFSSLETFEHRYGHLANKPLEFLIFLKKTRVHKLMDTSSLTQYAMVCLKGEINIEDVTDLLSGIQIVETGETRMRNENLLKLMSTPVLLRSITVPGEIIHISCVTPDQVWISSGLNLNLINLQGDILHNMTYVMSKLGQHTVNLTGDLIFKDRHGDIIKISKDYRTKSTPIKKEEPWVPQCIYSSHLNGDLLVGMHSYHSGIIARFNDIGLRKQIINHDNTGQKLYSHPFCITENQNGDVIVSDHGSVVVTESGGKYRFSYTGNPRGSGLSPRGICTDVLSHILVCDSNKNTIHMIDRDGHFLSLILTSRQGTYRPTCLSYDNKTHLLLVGVSSKEEKEEKVCVFRHIEAGQ